MNQRSTLLGMASMLLLGVAGCQQRDESSVALPQQTVQATALSAKKAATAAEWHAAINKAFDKVDVGLLRKSKNKTYVKSEGSTNEDGVLEFSACFDQQSMTCQIYLAGKSDRFRKIQFFSDPIGELQEMLARIQKPPRSMIRAYVSLPDCKVPAIVVLPVFRSNGSWLFMDQLSIMLNGTVVFDRKFDSVSVDRETDDRYGGVREASHIILTGSDVEALRSLPGNEANVIIRLSGQRSYVTLEKDYAENFARHMRPIYAAYDALLQASKSVGPVEDNACP